MPEQRLASPSSKETVYKHRYCKHNCESTRQRVTRPKVRGNRAVYDQKPEEQIRDQRDQLNAYEQRYGYPLSLDKQTPCPQSNMPDKYG
jgi:hypothetical protein